MFALNPNLRENLVENYIRLIIEIVRMSPKLSRKRFVAILIFFLLLALIFKSSDIISALK